MTFTGMLERLNSSRSVLVMSGFAWVQSARSATTSFSRKNLRRSLAFWPVNTWFLLALQVRQLSAVKST